MSRSTKESWLKGEGDLKTAEVEDVPVPGQSVLVRGLPAAYSNRAGREALTLTQLGRENRITIDQEKLEAIQFAHGVVEPQFTLEEAQAVQEKYGPAFTKVVAKIDELSGISKEDVVETRERFPAGGEEQSDGGDVGPVPAAAGGS